MKNKFEVIRGENKPEELESKWERLEDFAEKYSVDKDKEPRWCVFGDSPDGRSGVLYWIDPDIEGDRFVAYKMVQLIDELGGNAYAGETEWNPDLEGDPIYKEEEGAAI